MAKIGFLGAGNMGQGMLGCLLGAGHQVSVYNRTQSKLDFLKNSGAVVAASPREAAVGADAIFAMVSDDAASRSIWLDEAGALSAELNPEVIIIECSTLSYDWVLELSGVVNERGLSYLDCPVTGWPETAGKGALTLFLGGDTETIKRATPYLEPVSSAQIHFGAVGAGTAYKLIVNLIGSIQIASLGEGLLVAEKAGLDLGQVVKAIGMGAAASPQVKKNSELMLEAEFDKDVSFDASLRLKDTRYGVDFAAQMGQNTPFGQVALEAYQELVDTGFAELSESKIIDVLRTD